MTSRYQQGNKYLFPKNAGNVLATWATIRLSTKFIVWGDRNSWGLNNWREEGIGCLSECCPRPKIIFIIIIIIIIILCYAVPAIGYLAFLRCILINNTWRVINWIITIIIIIAVILEVIYHAVFQLNREMSVPEEFMFITVDFDESAVDNMAYLLTYSMEQSPSWEANWLQLVKKFPAFYVDNMANDGIC
jgi:hypothetical protein